MFKKFLIIPILLVIYLWLWTTILPDILNNHPISSTSEPNKSRTLDGVEKIVIKESVSVKVMRPYLGGIVMLPTCCFRLLGGNIGWVHDSFFWFLVFLFIIFVILEIRNRYTGFIEEEEYYGLE